MNPNADFAAALEQSLAVVSSGAASAASLKLAAEEARGVVVAIDTESELGASREAKVMADMAGRPLGATLDALGGLADDTARRMLLRKIAVSLGAQTDVRSRDAAKAEAARDEARKPFAAQARRVQDLAKALARYPTLAARIVELFVTDVAVRRLSKSAYSRVPRDPQSRAVGYGNVFEPQRAIATPEILQKMILPRIRNGARTDSYFPGRYGDLTFIENPNLDVDASIGAELAELSRGAPTVEAVNRAVAKADAHLISEFSKCAAAIIALKALDASITAAELGARYPDGGLIFDPEMFPEWAIRQMSRWLTLPELGGYQIAAE